MICIDSSRVVGLCVWRIPEQSVARELYTNRQKYEDNSAAIKASKRSRYWNDPATDWLNVLPRGRSTTGSQNYHHLKVCYGML